MKFMFSCGECISKESRGTLMYVPFHNHGLYDVTCEFGHRNVFVLQSYPFETLYQIACNAMLDGYYREAVTTFASSLERFYEFSIRVLFRVRGFDHPEIEKAWKGISNLSERQLGAFVAMWTAQFEEVPKTLSEDQVKIRNAVVHKGEIPSRADTLKYGQAVLDLVRTHRKVLKDSCRVEIFDIVGRRNGDLMRSVGAGIQVSLTAAPSAVSLSDESVQPDSLEEILSQMQEMRRGFESVADMFKRSTLKLDGNA
ncbi:MAG: hypothetical protein DI562_20810 [Stenotrophomonas acidaminiphila]|nr:MAG: hypothetical protein DI562_20810 [Stenotrophomonas acidaminiphila]